MEASMENQPLTSGQQTTVLIFILLMIPAVLFAVGLIPAILLGWGVHMAKRNQDFSHIESAWIAVRWYLYLFAIASLITVLSVELSSYSPFGEWESIATLLIPATPFIALLFTREMFYSPLQEHHGWVIQHGIFTNQNTPGKKTGLQSRNFFDTLFGRQRQRHNTDVTTEQAVKTSASNESIADELKKWAELRDTNAISEDDYHQAKQSLLQRMS
jgi:hypothetical protein